MGDALKFSKCPKGRTNQAGQRGLVGLSRHGPLNFREARPSTREKPPQIEIRHRPISRAIRRSRPRDRRAKADAKAANHPAWQEKTWEANPYWVRLRSHSEPLPEYLTLTGGPREVELGAFMTPEERRRLSAQITTLLRAARRANPQSDMAD